MSWLAEGREETQEKAKGKQNSKAEEDFDNGIIMKCDNSHL